MPRFHSYLRLFLLLSCCFMAVLLPSCTVPRSNSVSVPTLFQQAGTTLSTYHGHRNAVTAVAWSPDGSRLASASYDKTVQVWMIGKSGSGDTLLTYHGHFNWVKALAWSPDGKKIASAGLDTTVQIWNAASGRALLTDIGHVSIVTAVAWSPDGKKIASVSFDKTIQIWDVLSK